jgi:ABC-2 type transport system permease protein
MKWIRIKAIARKEFLQVRRDPFSLAMAILLPIILLIIFAYAITFDVDKIGTVVYDMDKSSLSRGLIDCFSTSDYFRVAGYIDRMESVNEWLDRRKAKVAITIPPDFSKKVRTGRKAEVSVILDGSDSNTATIAQGYIAAVSELYAQRVGGQRVKAVIDVRQRVWYNTELRSRNFIIPGLIAVIMAVIIALLTSLTISREWDRGTMEQLVSTPVRPAELIVGKLIPYFLIGLIDTILCIIMGTLAFHVPLRGSVPLLLALSSLFLFGGLSFGIFISIVAKNQLAASQIAMLATFLPAFLLSGFVFSVSNMPLPLQAITYAVPARYFVTILKAIFLKGSTLRLLITETILLSLFALVVFLASVKAFKKRVD